MAGIFFLGGWAWFAYFQGREVEARGLPVAHDGLTRRDTASSLPAIPDDPDAYARKVFGGLMPIEAVLASRTTARPEAGLPGCTYAIVRTGAGIAQTPPTSALGTVWWERFGGDWRQTPARLPAGLTTDALAACRSEWQDGLGDELLEALAAPGNWYMRSATGEDLHIFSAGGRLAARIRHGS